MQWKEQPAELRDRIVSAQIWGRLQRYFYCIEGSQDGCPLTVSIQPVFSLLWVIEYRVMREKNYLNGFGIKTEGVYILSECTLH